MHAADIQDRDGGALVMATMFGLYPFLLKLYADGGYQGPAFRRAVRKIMAQVNVEIVKRSDHAKGFVVLAKAMGRRTHIRMARTLPTARQGLGKSQSKGARVPAPRLHQAHVEKAMQSRMISPDNSETMILWAALVRKARQAISRIGCEKDSCRRPPPARDLNGI